MTETGPDRPHASLSQESLRRSFHRLALRYCPPWLRSEADDVAQDAWLRYRNSLKKSEGNRDPGPSLLARVAYCATVDEIRKRRRRREVPAEEAADATAGGADGPERSVAAREIGEGIRYCLGRLIPNRKRAVTLYLQGHTGPETGALLGWTLKRAENMIFRGLADLRRCLAARGLRP
jgi:RNA polymerase sigma-70 factor (ECF subfamily)